MRRDGGEGDGGDGVHGDGGVDDTAAAAPRERVDPRATEAAWRQPAPSRARAALLALALALVSLTAAACGRAAPVSAQPDPQLDGSDGGGRADGGPSPGEEDGPPRVPDTDAPTADGAREPGATDAAVAADVGREPDGPAALADAGASDAGGSPSPPPPPPPLCRMELDCAGMTIRNSTKILCRFEVRDGEGATVYADHAGIELRGRSSLQFPKKNYSIELRTAAGEEHSADLFGMGGESDWVLDGSWADRSLMRNALVMDTFRTFGPGRWAPEGRFCTLALDGDPQGIYRLVEKIKRDDDRLDIPADTGAGTSFVIKQDETGVLRFPFGIESRWELIYPHQDRATPEQRAGVQGWLDGLLAALASTAAAGGGSGEAAGVFSYLNLDATVDWILLEEMAKNIDAYDLSAHIARGVGADARFVPWDLDLSLGQPTIRGTQPAEMINHTPQGWVAHRPTFIRVLGGIAALRERLGPRWRALRAGPLATDALLARLDGYAVTLAPAAVAENFALWPLEEIDYNDIHAPYTLYRVASYADEVAKLRAFLTARLDWIDGHIDGYPN